VLDSIQNNTIAGEGCGIIGVGQVLVGSLYFLSAEIDSPENDARVRRGRFQGQRDFTTGMEPDADGGYCFLERILINHVLSSAKKPSKYYATVFNFCSTCKLS